MLEKAFLGEMTSADLKNDGKHFTKTDIKKAMQLARFVDKLAEGENNVGDKVESGSETASHANDAATKPAAAATKANKEKTATNDAGNTKGQKSAKDVSDSRKGTADTTSNVSEPPQKKNGKTRFTDEDMAAIVNGVRIFGVGQWAKIRLSDPCLHRLTAMQIKDKYRHIISRKVKAENAANDESSLRSSSTEGKEKSSKHATKIEKREPAAAKRSRGPPKGSVNKEKVSSTEHTDKSTKRAAKVAEESGPAAAKQTKDKPDSTVVKAKKSATDLSAEGDKAEKNIRGTLSCYVHDKRWCVLLASRISDCFHSYLSAGKPALGKKALSGTHDTANTETSEVGGEAKESASNETPKNLNESTVAAGQTTESEQKSSKKKKKRKRSKGHSAADSELLSSPKKPK